MITITSRLNSDPNEYNLVKLSEFEDNESKVSIPMYKRKKYVIITARVHPGETNSSFAMEGLIKYLLGDSLQAKQLRKRIVFKIVPMLNVDGVIAGNYRTSLSGNDLNRQYSVPDKRLHPEIFTMRNIIKNLTYGKKKAANQKEGIEIQEEEIMAFIDVHGHSMKKNVFMYGNQFPLSSEKYYLTRLIPKLFGDESEYFRYYSSQFKYEHYKRNTARIYFCR